MNNSLPVEVLEAEVECLRKEYKLALREIECLKEKISILEGKRDDEYICTQKGNKRTQRGKFTASKK